ncbi:leucyl aminopeptidase [Litorihabitans aurantiacus]|uniref:Probable cytosol aminopeptidase n=1 Tax=Litorihabitans aurantiacus TaxID=1930061 RepID=A0AA37XE50_9MICO|nr:leucyl aminopeptidase [Litorihabitans aurantiacus]GMA31501.1 putative cytosol aminopeptidase [Litorihabitans aurantiacus]
MPSTPVIASRQLETIDTDALVVFLAGGGGEPGTARILAEASDALTDELLDAVAALGLTGRADEVTLIPASPLLRASAVVLTGVGGDADHEPTAEFVRRAAGAAVRAASRHARVAVVPPSEDATAVAAAYEGALLGAYAFTRYRERPASKPEQTISVVTSKSRSKDVRAGLERAGVVARAVTSVRDLVNASPSDLTPAVFADEARTAVGSAKVKVSVADMAALRAGGYGGIVGVGQGSVNEPRLVTLSYSPARAKAHVALVGKGITFDSGGLSLKPPTSMITMKSDMAGAASVLHTVLAVAELGLPVRVTGFLALAENMPSGTAQRPSDVVTMRGGKTVEILNTDAEGRLVMADALVDAVALEPDAVIDIATLTGAQMVALGARTTGVMGDDGVRDAVVAAAGEAGEASWAMPLPEELREGLDSPIADLANIGGKFGGMLTAAVFLKEFTGSTPWAHLDIAGPSFNEGKPWGYTGKGGTGAGVRTLLTYLENVAATGEVR